MDVGPVEKPIDDVSANTTSDAVDCLGYKRCFILVHDEGSFAGTITILGLLSYVKSDGSRGESGSTYKQYGSALTLDRVELIENVPPKIKVKVVRSAGAVSVWVQPVDDS